MNNGMKITLKILLILMIPTFCQNGGGHYEILRGVKNFKKRNVTPLKLGTKEYA